jgi:hypothetical protein
MRISEQAIGTKPNGVAVLASAVCSPLAQVIPMLAETRDKVCARRMTRDFGFILGTPARVKHFETPGIRIY